MLLPDFSGCGADMVPTHHSIWSVETVMPTLRLSKRTLDGIVPREKTTIYYDADLTGFGVRVTPAGARAWVIEYRPNGGGRGVASKRMTIGAVGTLTPDEARREARELLAAARLGQDPASKRAHQRRTPSFAEVSQQFLLDRANQLKPRTLVNYELYFRIHALPHLGCAKLDAITPGDLTHLHRRIGQSKPITANRVIRAIGSLYRYASETRVVEPGFNPTSGIKLFREQPHDRYLSIEELERLGTALREAESQGLPWDVDETKPTSKHAPKGERRTILGPSQSGRFGSCCSPAAAYAKSFT